MHKVSIIAKLSKFDQLKTALNDLGVTGITVTQGFTCQKKGFPICLRPFTGGRALATGRRAEAVWGCTW